MITQNMTIKPSGKISGDFNYAYDADGKISYDINILSGFFIFKKAHAFNGALKVDPQFLKSENLVLGMEMILKGLSLKLEKVDKENQEAVATVSYKDGEIKGLVIFNLSKEWLQLKSIFLSGQLEGQELTIDIN